MMKMQEPLKAGRVFVNPIYKDKATVLKTGEDTGGRYCLGELEVAPGGGNFLHVHSAFTETFTAMKGTLGVQFKNRRLFLKPGESITVPLYTPHCFFNNGSEPVVCHVKLEPAHDGFIKGIAIAYGLAADGRTDNKGKPKNLMHTALIMSLTDTLPVGMIRWLKPLFSLLAKRAKKEGVEEALLRQYYYERSPSSLSTAR